MNNLANDMPMLLKTVCINCSGGSLRYFNTWYADICHFIDSTYEVSAVLGTIQGGVYNCFIDSKIKELLWAR